MTACAKSGSIDDVGERSLGGLSRAPEQAGDGEQQEHEELKGNHDDDDVASAQPFMLEPVQVYRTPGANPDIFRALQTLPGVSAPDEAAGLFVRGGDVSEVLVSLDDAVIAHPYRA